MLDRRDWTGLPQYSAFALNKGSKTSSGMKQGTEAGAGGDSDGDAEAEMDVRKGMEAYYRRSGSGGVSDEVKGVERSSDDDSDDDMSYRSPGRNVRFEEEIDVRREIGDMNNGYSLFNLDEQEEEEQEVEGEVEGEVEVDMSDIESSDISNFSNAAYEGQADGEETVIEEEEVEDVYDSAEVGIEEEGEVEVVIEEEDFSSLLSDVDKWLSEN